MKTFKKIVCLGITLGFGFLAFWLGKILFDPNKVIFKYIDYFVVVLLVVLILFLIICHLVSKRIAKKNNNLSNDKNNDLLLEKNKDLSRNDYDKYLKVFVRRIKNANTYYYFILVLLSLSYLILLFTTKPWFIFIGLFIGINVYQMIFSSFSQTLYPNEKFILSEEEYLEIINLVKKAKELTGINKDVICFINSNTNISFYEGKDVIFISLGIFIVQLLNKEELYSCFIHEFIKVKDQNSRKVYKVFESLDKWDVPNNITRLYSVYLKCFYLNISKEIPVFSDLSLYHFEVLADEKLANYCNPEFYLSSNCKCSLNNIYMDENKYEFIDLLNDDDLPLNFYTYIKLTIIDYYKKNQSLIDKIIVNNLPDEIQSSPTVYERMRFFKLQTFEIKFDDELDEIPYLINKISDMTYEHYNQIFQEKKNEYEYYHKSIDEYKDKNLEDLSNYELSKLSFAHYKLAEYDKALKENNLIISRNKNNSLALFEKGNILLSNYDIKGIDYIKKAYEINYNFFFDGQEIIYNFTQKMGLIEDYEMIRNELHSSKKYSDIIIHNHLLKIDKWYKITLNQETINEIIKSYILIMSTYFALFL